eukprot:3107174-Rhodomonas_salina.3
MLVLMWLYDPTRTGGRIRLSTPSETCGHQNRPVLYYDSAWGYAQCRTKIAYGTTRSDGRRGRELGSYTSLCMMGSSSIPVSVP